jgi:hypothetical protein
MFFTRLLQCSGKDLTRCFQCFYRDCTRLLIVCFIRFLQAFARPSQGVYSVCYKVFTRRLQSCLQGFHSVFCMAFTVFFYMVCAMFVCEAVTMFVAMVLQDCYPKGCAATSFVQC